MTGLTDAQIRSYILILGETFWVLLAIGWTLLISYHKKLLFMQLQIQRRYLMWKRALGIGVVAFLIVDFFKIHVEGLYLDDFLLEGNIWESLFQISYFTSISREMNMIGYIPVLLALYYFYYRQQRNVSESYILKTDITFFNLFCTMLLISAIVLSGRIECRISLFQGFTLIGTVIWSVSFTIFVFRRLRVNFLITRAGEEIVQCLEVFSEESIQKNKADKSVL